MSTVYYCKLEEIEPGKYRCTNEGCGAVYTSKFKIHQLHKLCRARPKLTRATRIAAIGLRPTPGVGDHMARLIEEKLGEKPEGCSGCGGWISQMNAWGTAGCYQHETEILDRLMDQVENHEWEPGKMPTKARAARVAAKFPILRGMVRSECKAMLDEAIRRSEAEER